MKNRLFRMTIAGRVAVLVGTVMLMAFLSSCRHDTHSDRANYAHYVEVDSRLNGIDHVDSLAAIAARYHDAGDAIGELLALKYQGRVLRHQAQYDVAISVHSHCLDMATEMCDTLSIIDALNQLATDYRRKGDMSNANGYYYKALKMGDNYSDHDSHEVLRSHVYTLSGIANIEIELCHYASADSLFHEAMNIERQLDSNSGIAISYSNLGDVKHALGELDSAWIYYRESMKYNQLDGNQNGIALCHLHFGKLYQKERNFSHARKEFLLAFDSFKELGDTYYWLESCIALAEVGLLLGEETESRRYAKEAETEALRINSKEHLANAYRLNYELALLEGKPQQALDYFVKSDAMYDSIYGLEKSDEMRRQRIAYQNNVKEGKYSSLNSDIIRLKRMRNLLTLLMVMMLAMVVAIIGVSIYSMRVRSRSQRLMSQVEETRSLFFTNIVHQLRTPLSAIMGATDSIIAEADKAGRADDLPPEQRENVEIIERQGKNLLTLVDRILEVGGVRSALKELDWRTGDVMTFLRMIVESYRETCVERHIELSFAPRDVNIDISTVPHYLNTIVGSLIENAINYSHEFGKITITSRVDKGWLTIKVADNGIGISKTDLLHVFEPFYRSAVAEQIVDGVGIGLTVVRDMAMAMGGTVAADSMKDHGSVFTVKLPCSPEKGMKHQLDMVVAPIRNIIRRSNGNEERASLPATNESTDNKSVVLIVEDHEDVALLVGKHLGEGYEVHYAMDGEQGLTMVRELMPDLIITDVKMPTMDGYEFCGKVRASRRLCHIPIIMLSARNSQLDRMRGIEAGADAYLVKPFVPEEMRAWVKHLLDSRKQLREVYTQPSDLPQQPVSPNAGDADHQFLELFGEEISKQLSDIAKIDFDQIAMKLKMGESQLRRKILTLTGKTMPSYVMQLRMEKAWQMLRNHPDMLVGDIASQCGFADVAYFSRVFRQHFGMTPTQARTQ